MQRGRQPRQKIDLWQHSFFQSFSLLSFLGYFYFWLLFSSLLSVWPSHLSQWHSMWSGAGPRAYSHWLIKTHMRKKDLIWRERSGLLSEGLITHSHWVACSLSHTWLCVCVCEKCDHGCDLAGVCRQASVRGIDCALRVVIGVWKCVYQKMCIPDLWTYD